MKKTYSISNKITGLKKLRELGFLVPKFDFIPDYTEIGLTDYDINLNYPPEKLKKIITNKLKGFNFENGISVRSASFDEDTGDKSSAGRYISFNGLSDKNEIIASAIKVWQHHRHNSKNVLCPLIIQETHPSYYSGVIFKDADLIIIESYYGACSNIVDGSVKPYSTVINNNKITHRYSENSNYAYLYSVFKNADKLSGEKLIPKEKTYTYNNRLYSFINNKMIYVYGTRPDSPIRHYESKILPQLIEIAKKTDNPKGVDIEWGSDKDGNVFVYQFRTLTRQIQKINNIQNETTLNPSDIYGIPVSQGIVEGTTENNINNLNSSSILVIKKDNIDDISILSKIKGIISYNGGILSHLSIICREYGIPCVVGVNKQVPIGAKVIIDGSSGIIKIL